VDTFLFISRNLRKIPVIALFLGALLSTATFANPGETDTALTAAAKEHRTRLEFDGDSFSGPALDQLLTRAGSAQFFLIGEEHGIAENPKLAAQLFATLVADGYEKLVIEISPPMAAILESAVQNGGIEGLRTLYASPGGKPAFFGMREEAELLAAVRAALPEATEVFWGVDYEVLGDRALLRQLNEMERPASSDAPLENLIAASDSAWSKYSETGSPQYVFSFSGDPALVTAVINAWPDANDRALRMLETLRSTLEINQLWMQGRGWESNARRAALIRSNFLTHWHDANRNGATPRILAKLGSNHLLRGRNMTGTFDLGALLPEIASADGGQTFSLMVLPGMDSLTAVMNPSTWTYSPQPAKDNYAEGLEALTDAAYSNAFTLIDLAALRPIVGSRIDRYGADVARVVHGFDMLLVMSGSTASSNLEHD
jgi:hypothetical protein